MNKLVIVGNGFDLAHGLPTSYKHFIEDFWSSFYQNHQKKEVVNLMTFNTTYLSNMPLFNIKCYDQFVNDLKVYCSSSGYDLNEQRLYCRNKPFAGFSIVFEFKNSFFKEINEKSSIENWVDIENEYYQELKIISKRKITSYSGSKEAAEKKQIKTNKKDVLKLNVEFKQVKDLFEEYLERKITSVYDLNNFKSNNWSAIYNYLRPISLFNNESGLNGEFLIKEDWDEIEKLFAGETKGIERITDTYILNFNYTLTTSKYIYDIYKDRDYSEKIIHIHGILSNKINNQINFGFGDEMDNDYKLIENLGDNEYLKNFKSFQYSQNSNYQNLIRIIESGKFQVFIMGHSCGLSDRTLLNTIFEHENCRSIKVFYYQRVNEDGGKVDNFTEIVQNISRHFNDKKKMREKIVNKSLCKPLPQDIRFQEKKPS